ncbi:hypothetical protein PCIT_b0327 [Pseudoalteromonas citrea]|uniref:DUF1294 domain-containing protein n=2 Tax=Pseudoalteromonas citrea TaxID=43655 RepID=A0AAD4AEA0_9GAMM|nr:DUF1294 domain-containing protein [Pseudoalteromonas citrea]KAF7764351.1 hypothetical protein PCIT_b0327 [Pseudoalteromonas citrea]
MNRFVLGTGKFVLLLNGLMLILLGAEFTHIALSCTVLLGVTNILFISVFWLDKRRACRQGQRISEMTLLVLSFIAANLSMFVAQSVLSHKSKKWQFNIKLLLSLLCQTAILIIVCYWLLSGLASIRIEQ